MSAARPVIESYRTISHPHEFHLDWKGFYNTAYDRGAALRARTRHEPGVAYGEDPAQRFNIFFPAAAAPDAPVFVFMHGGAFQEGHPDFYDFVGEPLLDRGVIFVSMGYRLEPVRFPHSADDVASGLAFLDRRLRSGGFTPARYCLSGHSAGAAIAALLSVRPELVERAGFGFALIDSTVLLSGIYDFRPPEVSQRFVDPEFRDDASPILHCTTAPRETVLVYGLPEINFKTNDPTNFQTRANGFAKALLAHGHDVTLVELPNTNHMGTACALERAEVLSVILRTLRLPHAAGREHPCV